MGDRYGRKLMLVLGMIVSIPACLLADFASSIEVQFAARSLGGVAAGMAYPTTLALITALWARPARTTANRVVVRRGWGHGSARFTAVGLADGALQLEVGVPGHAAAGGDRPGEAVAMVPAHISETTDAVDNLSGILSVVLVLSIDFAAFPGQGSVALLLGRLAILAVIGFVLRQQRAPPPLFDLHIAARRIFWVAAIAGMTVFGTL